MTFFDGMQRFAIALNTVSVIPMLFGKFFGGIMKIGLETSKIQSNTVQAPERTSKSPNYP